MLVLGIWGFKNVEFGRYSPIIETIPFGIEIIEVCPCYSA